MSDLEELERKIQNLPAEELSKFRAWFIEFDHRLWDKCTRKNNLKWNQRLFNIRFAGVPVPTPSSQFSLPSK